MARKTVDERLQSCKKILGGGKHYIYFCATMVFIAVQVWFSVSLIAQNQANRAATSHFLTYIGLGYLILPLTGFIFMLPMLLQKGSASLRADALYVAFWFMGAALMVPGSVVLVAQGVTV